MIDPRSNRTYASRGHNGRIESHLFIAGGTDDPRCGFSWCKTGDGVTNRVVQYLDEIAKSFGCGWLGHAGHVHETITEDEVHEFRLNWGRRYRVVYSVLRAHYTEYPELFVREVLAPIMNQAALSKKKLRTRFLKRQQDY